MAQVIVRINKDGSNVEIDNIGFSGSSCEDLTKAVSSSIGSIEEIKTKPEYYETNDLYEQTSV